MKKKSLKTNVNVSKRISVEQRAELFLLLKNAMIAVGTIVAMLMFMPTEGRPIITISIKVLICFGILRALYIVTPNRNNLHERGRKIVDEYSSLTTEQKLYVNVCIVLLFLIFIVMLGGMPFMKGYIILFSIFCICVVLYDVHRLLKALSRNFYGKGLMAVAFAASSNLAYSLAGQAINEIVHVTPTNFVHTTLFIAILTIPVLLVLAGGGVYVIGLFTSVVIMLPPIPSSLKKWLFAGLFPETTMKYAVVTRIFQVVFYMTIGTTIFHLGQKAMKWYENKIAHMIPELVYQFDMYQGGECSLEPSYKLAPLGDAKFLLAEKSSSGEISFKAPVKCDELSTH
jgi:hypothetical protein